MNPLRLLRFLVGWLHGRLIADPVVFDIGRDQIGKVGLIQRTKLELMTPARESAFLHEPLPRPS